MEIMKANYQIYNSSSSLKKKDEIDTNLACSCTRFTFDSAHSKTVKICQIGDGMDQNGVKPYMDSGIHNYSGEVPEDGEYSIVPSLCYELEDLIFARFPRSEYWKLSFLNKRCVDLLKSGELFKIRREIGFEEPSVFMLASGDNTWWSFDREFKSCRNLPDIPADPFFRYGDKESICAGTHLLVSGWDVDGHVIWRYDLATNQWEKGPSMKTPRSLFASATCGNSAYVAGGIDETNTQVYDAAEKYNSDSKSWEALPRMNRRRKLCSGFYMDNKFYVIGGRNEEGKLTCGEYFDEATNKWTLVPDMIKDNQVQTCNAPPLHSVVNNELYSLETPLNELKVYSKKTNTWKRMGQVPVKANCHKGWGVAFKSLGNELLVIGAALDSSASMAIYTCCPDPGATELQWRRLESGRDWFSHFILNCSVMTA